MAIYHYEQKPVSRGKGQSAVAGAAYRAADKLHDRRIDQTFDYSRRSGVAHAEIVLPTAAARQDINWARNRQNLWNRAEGAERRRDSRVAREHEVALPHELNKAQQIGLLRDFAAEIANRYNVAVDFALHRPHRHGDQRNFHAHVYATTREILPSGLGPKASIELSDTDRFKRGLSSGRVEIKFMRKVFEKLENEHLQRHGIEARVDCRTLKAQGIDRVPTTHLGVAVSGLERRGIPTQVGERIREQRELEGQRRLEQSAELAHLEREGLQLERSITQLAADLKVARAFHKQEVRQRAQERALGPQDAAQAAAEAWKRRYGNKARPSIEKTQRQAREEWLKLRREREQAQAKATTTAEIAPLLPIDQPREGPRAKSMLAWNEMIAAKPIELQAQVLATLRAKLQGDRATRLDGVLERAQARHERRVGRVQEFAKEEPQAPKGVLGGLRRRAYEENHRAWRERSQGFERLSDQSRRQQQRLIEARDGLMLQAHANRILKQYAPEIIERVQAHTREQHRLERERSPERSRGKDLDRDFDLER